MSGGFFRGTSADQDTRFSNKQAKLLKTQKFSPELDHLVDMTKVKMDVIRPWIANRVTELLGFEDEVLINFIYGLLDGKDVNGKEVQIQLTGFMEKNTGKFMKELWTLLLSAQKNASGVPQQFLDAKEEETRKKKAEADRITHEIQKKKEKELRELEREKMKKMDGEIDVLRTTNSASDPISRRSQSRASSVHPDEEKEADGINGSRGNNRVSRSPHLVDHSPSSHRSTHSRSISRSFSNSRSYSGDGHKSRSISGSPQPRRRSNSPEREYRSPRRRSISPHRRHSPRRSRSPLRRRSPHSRHKSPSLVRRRLPSPLRRRSPSIIRRRSPSPVRRRSPSPIRRRSPSLVRRRSPPPLRRRSPSPPRHRSPVRRRPPIRRRSRTPSRHRSPSPLGQSLSPPRRRSLSPGRRRSPLPRSPRYRRRSPRQRNRSGSPYRSHSPAYRSRRSLSRDRDLRSNGVDNRRYRYDASERKMSPVRKTPEREEVDRSIHARKEPVSVSRRPPISLRSPQRDPDDQRKARQKMPTISPSPEMSRSPSVNSPRERRMSPSEDSLSESPVRQTRERLYHRDSPSPARQPRKHVSRHDNSVTSEEEETSHARDGGDNRTDSSRKRAKHSPPIDSRKRSPSRNLRQERCSLEKLDHRGSGEDWSHLNDTLLRKKDGEKKSEKASARTDPPRSPTKQKSPMLEEIEYGPGRPEGESYSLDRVRDEKRDSPIEELQRSHPRDGQKSDEKKHSRSSHSEGTDRVHKMEAVNKSMKKVDRKNRAIATGSESEENDKYRLEYMEKRKHKRMDRHEMNSEDDECHDSEIDERKEAKRRRKEEKRLRKEEKRRRREERHRRKEEKRAAKLKAKSMDTVTPPSDFEKNRNDGNDSDDEADLRRESHPCGADDTESEQKKLEIELRKKALESLRAKKGINN
uniref:PWI domain-containing protein n=1 Tax=Nelumbo nucifera TaxID=4432 RepID=A0A822Y234_NELNU|nr:TPA_asm: hypothetical protein HUJ06_027975 [Nelumbo nucifera]